MRTRTPSSTRTTTLFPNTAPVRSRLRRRFGEVVDFVGGAVLDRVRYVDHGRIEAERLAMRLHRLLEGRGGDVHARNAATVEVRDVMQTARRAGPSVAQRFDDDAAFGGYPLRQRDRGDLGVGRLRITLHREAALGQPLVELVDEQDRKSTRLNSSH